MDINTLPPELKALAIQRALEQSSKGYYAEEYEKGTTDLNLIFTWSDTPEKNEFWTQVCIGRLDIAKTFACYPKPLSSVINDQYEIY